jgi:hypothetical protein
MTQHIRLQTYQEILEFIKLHKAPNNIDQHSLIIAYSYFHGTHGRYGSGLKPDTHVCYDLHSSLFQCSIEQFYLSCIQDEYPLVRRYYQIMVNECYKR